MKKRISDTYVYKVLSLEKYIDNIAEISKDYGNATITKPQFDLLTNEFRYKINFSTRNAIMQRLLTNKMVIINKENLFLPAWCIRDPHGKVVKTFVNLFGKVKIKDQESMSFTPREVFGVCQIGYFIEKFYDNEARILNNQNITTYATEIYMRLMFRIIDSIYAIDSASNQAMVTRFLINKFFLVNVLEKENNATTDEMAFRPLKNMDHMTRLKTAIGNEDPTMYNSLEEFFAMLPNYVPVLKNLELSAVLRKYVLLYGEKSLLILENYYMFLAIISSSVISSGYIRDFAIEQFLGKEAISMYNLFIDMTKD